MAAPTDAISGLYKLTPTPEGVAPTQTHDTVYATAGTKTNNKIPDPKATTFLAGG